MPEQDDKLNKLFGTNDPDKVLKDVQETLNADKAFIQEEMAQIKDLASGNKALNAIQIFDAVVRRRDDDKLEKAVAGMNASTETIEKDAHGAKKGRQDIREDINNAEIRLTKEIRAAGGRGQIGGVTQKLNKAGDTRGMHPNSQATQFKPQAGGTTEIANSIKLGLMPSRIGILKEAGGASRALGSLTRNITTDEGVLDAAKVERLQEVLQDEKVKDDFNKYVSVLRNVTAKGEITEGQRKDLASTKERLAGKGLEDVIGKEFLNYEQSRLRMGGIKQFMGIDQGGFNPADIFRLRNFTKKDGIIQKIAGTQKRVRAEKDELKVWTDDLKEAMIQSDLRKSKQGRDAKREAMLGGVANEGTIFGGRAGIDTEGGIVAKKLTEIEENTRNLSKGGEGGGGILGMLGLILAALGLWAIKDFNVDDVTEGVQSSPSVAKRGLMGVNWLREKAVNTYRGVKNAPVKIADMWRKTFTRKPNTVTPDIKPTGPKFLGTDGAGNRIVQSAGGNPVIEGMDGKPTTRPPVGSVTPGGVIDDAATIAAKNTPKLAAKSTPFVGAGIGLGMALYRSLWEGDTAGAAAEITSGLSSFVPIVGTGASLTQDVGLIVRDIHRQPMDRAVKDDMFTKRTVGLFGNRMSELKQDDEYWSTQEGLDAAQRILFYEGDDMKKEDVQYLIDILKKGNRAITGASANPISTTSLGNALEVEGLTGLEGIEGYIQPFAKAIENSTTSLEDVAMSINDVPRALREVVMLAENRNPTPGPVSAILPASVTSRNHSWQRYSDSHHLLG